jgi:uncharacterized membrane protein YdbT with pleckstrin-like domain
MHLFSGMDEGQLAGIALKLQERGYVPDEVVFERGADPDGFYMIYSGRVNISRTTENGKEFLASLVAGDYFGEEAVFENRKRSATISAAEDTTVLFLSRKNFDELLTEYPKLKPNFTVAIKSRQLARKMQFKWLGPKEVIYFMARRHQILLYQALIVPVLTLVIPIVTIIWGYLAAAVTPIALGVIILIGIILWIIWDIVDWGNDYYIVTNQRVILLEKVVGIYDSRQEAPLGSILSVGVETDMLGRSLDYGNVIVRTFVGKIELDDVDHPAQAADMIREYWERAKTRGVQAQKDAMKNAIRSKLGLPVVTKPQEELPPLVVENKGSRKRSMMWIAFSNLFKLRVEQSGTVIYHKHLFVLAQQLWKPALIILGLIGFMISRAVILIRSPELTFFKVDMSTGRITLDTIMMSLLLLIFPFFLWLVWEYVDWRNDIFMVTPEEIVDLDKKPFGKEERRAAPLDNILSTEYERIGLLGNIFNFGTVFISVGGTKLSFQDVLDPPGVQADINRRRVARLAKKAEDSAAGDRERMATWIAAYHANQEEFNAGVPQPTGNGEMNAPGDEEINMEVMEDQYDDFSE